MEKTITLIRFKHILYTLTLVGVLISPRAHSSVIYLISRRWGWNAGKPMITITPPWWLCDYSCTLLAAKGNNWQCQISIKGRNEIKVNGICDWIGINLWISICLLHLYTIISVMAITRRNWIIFQLCKRHLRYRLLLTLNKESWGNANRFLIQTLLIW